MAKACSIPECENPSRRYDMCVMHASRLERHGDPNITKHRANGTAMRYLREVVLPYDGDDCLFWPYNRVKGYAHLMLGKKHAYVCRLICEELYGPPPSPRHHSRHSCDQGHLGCVTPRHLSWGTPKENGADRVQRDRSCRGSRHGLTKLTEDDVRQIRALRGTMSQRAIGERFGVSEDVVGCIHRRISWAWLD